MRTEMSTRASHLVPIWKPWTSPCCSSAGFISSLSSASRLRRLSCAMLVASSLALLSHPSGLCASLLPAFTSGEVQMAGAPRATPRGALGHYGATRTSGMCHAGDSRRTRGEPANPRATRGVYQLAPLVQPRQRDSYVSGSP